MKKARNLCIRALCAIFIGVVLGCSGSGDSGYEIDDNQGQQGGNQQNQGQQPAFYINEELGGQKFVDKGNWNLVTVDSNKEFNESYTNANQYINGKVAELQKLWQKENTGSVLSNQVSTALDGFNQGTSIGQKIRNNYTTLAPVFVTMHDSLIDDVDFFRFKASYHKLAHNAYNNSLGHWRNSEDNRVLTNKEMKNLSNNAFVDELEMANLSYDELTVNKAKEIMNNSLRAIANQTNTNTAVLKKVVELALYNESLYGLNDLAKLDKVVSLETPLREYSIFDSKINDARYNIETQSIDDGRTM